jgi:hypothetical protein
LPGLFGGDRDALQNQCTVTFEAYGDGRLTNVDFTAEYIGGPEGYFAESTSRAPACERGNQRLAINANAHGTMLRGYAVVQNSTDSVALPIDLMRCRFDAAGDVGSDAFEIDVTDASLNFVPVRIDGVRASVHCTTNIGSTSTTSSTIPDCTACAPNEACDAGVCVATEYYEIVFEVSNAARLGNIQWDTDYDSSRFDVPGTRTSTDCRLNPMLNAYGASNDRVVEIGWGPESGAELSIGIIFPFGIVGPVDIETCTVYAPDAVPAPHDFTTTLVDWADVSFDHPDPEPRVAVRTVRPIAR